MKIDEKKRATVAGLLLLADKRNKECESIRDLVIEVLELGDWDAGRDYVNDAIWAGGDTESADALIEKLERQAQRENDAAAKGSP